MPQPQSARQEPIEACDHPDFQLGKLILPAGEVQPLPTDRHHIVMHIGAPAPTRRSLDGITQQRLQLMGDFDVVPAGMAGHWRNEELVELLLIEIDPAFSARLGDDEAAPATMLPTMQLRDPHLHNLTLALLAEYRGPVSIGRIYAESLMTAMLARLVALRNGVVVGPGDSGDRFSLLQQRRLAEYVEDNIASDLSLPSLAGMVGYGLSRFKTLFNNSFGCTPHSYVVRRRVERARALIEAGSLPLSEIALETGFSHQSHMATAFRQALGLSPGQLRRALKS
jgi:AraC family transcriptional regulator